MRSVPAATRVVRRRLLQAGAQFHVIFRSFSFFAVPDDKYSRGHPLLWKTPADRFFSDLQDTAIKYLQISVTEFYSFIKVRLAYAPIRQVTDR